MENKFEDELSKIEKLLNKVDTDLSTDNMKTDFSTFFKNVDKTFEIYNICLEELCGQLYLLDLSSHSKVFRKLYHHYKHQLYNIMKYQLNLQKELNDKSEEEKNYITKIETLNSKLKTMKDKKLKLHSQLEEQKIKIEKLIIANSQQKDTKKLNKGSSGDKERNLYNINFESDADFEKMKEESQEDVTIKQSDHDELLDQVDNLLHDDNDGPSDPRLKQNLIKLLADIEAQKKKLSELRKESDILSKKNQEIKIALNKTAKSKFSEQLPVVKKNIEAMTSTVLFTAEEYDAVKRTSDDFKLQCAKLKDELDNQLLTNQRKVTELNVTISELQEEITNLKEGIGYMDSLNMDLKKEVHNFEIKEEGFNIHLQNLQNELEEYRKEYNDNLDRVKNLEDINMTLREELEKREHIVLQATQSITQLQELKGEKDELEKLLGDLEDRELKREVSLDDDVKLLLDNKSKKIEILEREINRLIKVNKDVTKQLSDEIEDKKTIQENFEELGEKYKAALQQIDMLKKILNQVQKSIMNEGDDVVKTGKSSQKRITDSEFKSSNMERLKDSQNGGRTGGKLNKQSEKTNMKKESSKKVIKVRNEVGNSKVTNDEVNRDNVKNSTTKVTNNQINESKKQVNKDSQNLVERNDNIDSRPTDKNNNIDNTKNNQVESKIITDEFNSQRELAQQPSQDEDRHEIFEISDSADDEDSDYEEDPKKSAIQRLMKFLGKDNFDKLNQDHMLDDEKLNMEAYLKAFMKEDEHNVNVVQVTCNRGIQCEYMSVVDYIRENRDLVVYYENDFEKIKDAIDVLTEIIGFNDSDELTDEDPDHLGDGTMKMTNAADNKFKTSANAKPKYNENRMIQTFEKKEKKFQLKSKAKEQTTKLDKAKLNYDPYANDIEPDNIRRGKNLSKSQVRRFKEKMQNSKPNETVVNKEIVMQEDSNEEDELHSDYIVQKNRIVASDGGANKYEIVEYVRIPKQLMINKSKLNPQVSKNALRRIYTFERKVLTQYEKQQREKEKIYFRIYMNLKKRYQFRPHDFIKVYKVYFNRIPDFSERVDEEYDPDNFLFSYAEFKEHFVQLLYMHQTCGANCIHLKRFYEKALRYEYNNKSILKVSNQLIDKVPEILNDQI